MKLNSNKLLLFSFLENQSQIYCAILNAESKIAANNYFM